MMVAKKICVLAFIFVIVNTGFSQNEKSMSPEQRQAMEDYARISALNENHEFLKKFEGEWKVSSKAWMMPGQDPIITGDNVKGEMILGGRFLMWRYQGTVFGQVYEYLQIIGYDNFQKKYVTFWIDNTSTAFYMLEGTREGNVITDTGLWPDPVTGRLGKVRNVIKFIGPDEFIDELFMTTKDGKEFKSLENHFTRGAGTPSVEAHAVDHRIP